MTNPNIPPAPAPARMSPADPGRAHGTGEEDQAMRKLTKAEREELRRLHLVQSDPDSRDINRLLADLDAAEAKVRTQFQATFDELRKALGDDIGSEGGLCAILTGIETIRAQRDRAEAERDALRGTLRRHGFQLCDIAACNCNGWHQTGGFYARFNEIDEAVGEHDGKTLLDAVKQIVSERDEAVALIDAAKSDVRPESFLEHAQAILAKCIAPYSCEQMKAVGDALAGCYRKWELMSEVALKAKDDADSMAKCKGCGGTVSDHLAPDQGGCPGSFEIDGVQMVPLAGRNDAIAQRDRAESERDAAEAERDEIKTALGVMGATRERALDVAGSQDALEERIDSMSRERDVALKGWSAAEAARDAAAAQRDRAESELDAERRMRVEAEAALDERDCDVHARIRAGYDTTVADLWRAKVAKVESERDALKAKLAAAESAHSELFLSGQVAELRGKLAAVVAAYDHVFGDFDHSALSVDARILFDAIAAARGGAS